MAMVIWLYYYDYGYLVMVSSNAGKNNHKNNQEIVYTSLYDILIFFESVSTNLHIEY
ncbi:hypothetical protein PIROE2DRAFT_11007 [Piromyces sp. E2]|nr:hypothetical protein PIROE2DRAFT_11007 [Piromyces sp. E2]|eukprot:OUM62633.1 hypothetical protein PIROE2DRAFT_11007 [Piromyces sp. E2]